MLNSCILDPNVYKKHFAYGHGSLFCYSIMYLVFLVTILHIDYEKLTQAFHLSSGNPRI